MNILQRIESSTYETQSGCVRWTGSCTKAGYGQLNFKDEATGKWKPRLVHRLIWEIKRGPIPEGLCVLHRCDNPPCCNVKHLFLGTRANNVDDAISKGRMTYALGEAAAGHKLLTPDVLEIRRLYDHGWAQVALARRFGVRVLAIFEIVHRKTWKHV